MADFLADPDCARYEIRAACAAPRPPDSVLVYPGAARDVGYVTSIASQPVAFEAPSAGFILDRSALRALRAHGAVFTTITHAAGISSTGDPDLDRMMPLDEPYVIPVATAALVNQTREREGRVIAVHWRATRHE